MVVREYGISVVQAFGQVPLQSRLEIPIERGRNSIQKFYFRARVIISV